MAKRELSLAEIAELKNAPTRTSTRGTSVQVPGTSRTVKIDPTIRTWEMWFKLPTVSAECAVPEHDLEEHARKAMCFELYEVMVCRYCYLKGLPEEPVDAVIAQLIEGSP
jgi:hypothetical protein